MEGKKKILDAEDFHLSLDHPWELSQSSEVISLPSANRLADLSLASDLTDTEVENEATVLTSSACGDHQGDSDDIQCEKNIKMPNNFSMKSGILPSSQRVVDSLKKDPNITDRQSEVPSMITKEKTGHDGNVSNGKSSMEFCSYMNVIEGEGITYMPTVSLDDVRAALQQHCNLLYDRDLLQDLLKSLDDKIEQEPVAGASIQPHYSGKKARITPDQKDFLNDSLEEENSQQLVFNLSIMSSPKSQPNSCTSNHSCNQGNHVVGGIESLVNPQADLPDDLGTCGTPKEKFNFSPVEEAALQKYPNKLATHPGFGRHVKFQSTTISTQDPLVQSEGNGYGDSQKLQCGTQQSLKILKKLAQLRWGLMGWEDVSSSPPTDNSSSITFLHHLLTSFQALQVEKKHLKEELTTTLNKFKDLSEESNAKKHMYEKRETRLVEADRQLGELQQAWAAAQEAEQQEAARLKAHCYVLKQENALLKKEGQCLRNDVMELKAMMQQHTLMKTQILETDELLAASKKKTAEVLDENNRLNLCREENMNYLQELEEVKVPQLLGELEDVKARAERLEDSNKQLSEVKAHLEEDLHMLQEQHKVLLKKIVEEQEKKAEVEQRKTHLEDEVKGWSGKVAAMKTQLHLHYQAQLEDLVARKSAALQEQLETLESNLQKNHEEQLNTQVECHQAACEKLKKRYEEEVRNMKSSFERQLEKLHCEMRELGQENHRLHQQRQGVISAVASVLGLEHETSGDPSRCWSLAGSSSSRQAGGSSASLDAEKDGSLKTGSRPTSGKNVGYLPRLSLQSSSSSDTESTMFHEGKQTVRHLGGHSQNVYHKNQNLLASSENGMNPTLGACNECQSLSAKHMKADNRQMQQILCCTHPGIENCGKSGISLKPNLYQNCKNQKSLDHKESLYTSFTTKIRKASEILQASDLSEEDVSYQEGEDMHLSPEKDTELARILKELKVQVGLSTQPQSDAPTHDTSLDQDPATLTLHRLSQVSSVLSQYVAHS